MHVDGTQPNEALQSYTVGRGLLNGGVLAAVRWVCKTSRAHVRYLHGWKYSPIGFKRIADPELSIADIIITGHGMLTPRVRVRTLHTTMFHEQLIWHFYGKYNSFILKPQTCRHTPKHTIIHSTFTIRIQTSYLHSISLVPPAWPDGDGAIPWHKPSRPRGELWDTSQAGELWNTKPSWHQRGYLLDAYLSGTCGLPKGLFISCIFAREMRPTI